MPTYTYACDHCGARLDIFQSFSDEALKDCPECGHPTLNRVYRPVGVVFKGSGFYATDNRSPSGRQNGTKSGDKPTSSESSGTTTSSVEKPPAAPTASES